MRETKTNIFMRPRPRPHPCYLILIIRRVLTVWPILLSIVCSQHPVPTHPSPQRSTLLRCGDGWMGTGCWYSGLPHCSGSTHHSILKQLMIPYQLLQQQAGRRGATLQHVDSVGIGMIALGMLALTDRLSRVALLMHRLHVGYLFT